ncbi:MAG: nicotinate-nucleotide--dimethylbenzimidazole phosphoribosyltransferase, partial [Nocardioidaceae bacterium]
MAPEPSSDHTVIAQTIADVRGIDADAQAGARAAMDAKTKPRGSLGRLEDLAVRIAGIRTTAQPARLVPAVIVCAADHGYADEGVSAYPAEVTAQMVRTLADGGAAACVLAREARACLRVADVGVRSPVEHPSVLSRRVRAGTANAVHGPAMTIEEAEQAVA